MASPQVIQQLYQQLQDIGVAVKREWLAELVNTPRVSTSREKFRQVLIEIHPFFD